MPQLPMPTTSVLTSLVLTSLWPLDSLCDDSRVAHKVRNPAAPGQASNAAGVREGCGKLSAIIRRVKSILDSIRVVELSEALAGPYCAMLLGDFGADVIKVERPGTGDQSRGWGPPFVGGESAYYLAANRNKRSIALDYHDAGGAEILQRLLARADVFLCNQPSPE